MALSEPSENLTLYTKTSGTPGYNTAEWFSTPLGSSTYSHVLAENVIALVLLPKLSAKEDTAGTTLAPNYSYDSAPISWPPPAPPATQPATQNQLPPLIQLTMVAIDEASAARLEAMGGDQVAKLNLAGLFQNAGDLTDASKPGYAKDLKTLTDTLVAMNFTYRVFTSEISIRGAKWSKN